MKNRCNSSFSLWFACIVFCFIFQIDKMISSPLTWITIWKLHLNVINFQVSNLLILFVSHGTFDHDIVHEMRTCIKATIAYTKNNHWFVSHFLVDCSRWFCLLIRYWNYPMIGTAQSDLSNFMCQKLESFVCLWVQFVWEKLWNKSK